MSDKDVLLYLHQVYLYLNEDNDGKNEKQNGD